MTFSIVSADLDDWELARSIRGFRVVLQVMAGNDRAARCYERSGLAPTGRQRSSEQDPGVREIEYAYAVTEVPGDVGDRG